MSALIIDKLVTKSGTLGTCSSPDLVDAAGTLKGSPQFLLNYLIDYAGNIGFCPSIPTGDCTFLANTFGSAFAPGPWEVQVGTVETVGSNESINPNNYGTAAFTVFASANTTGYMSGTISGSNAVTIQGNAQTIGGVTYPGGGLIVWKGPNTQTGTTTVEPGARLQIGADKTNTVSKTANLTIQADAQVTLYGAQGPSNTYVTQAVTNAGTFNIEGPNVCGQGKLLSTTVDNTNGVINLTNVNWRNQSTWSGSNSTVNVNDGATFELSTNVIQATTKININGCGWCNSLGVKVGALNFTQSSFTLNAAVTVKTPSCITMSGGISNADLSGLMTGGGALTLNRINGGAVGNTIFISNPSNTYYGTVTVDGVTLNSANIALQYAEVVLANGGRLIGANQTIVSLSSTDQTTYWQSTPSTNNYIRANGETTFSGRLLNDGVNPSNYYLNGGSSNILHLNHNTTTGGHTGTVYVRNGAKLVLEDGTKFTGTQGQVRVDTGAGILSSNTTTSSATYLYLQYGAVLDVQKVGAGASKITAVSGFDGTGGFKVNVPAGLTAGVYPIIQATAGGTITTPTVNTNLSGLTATFAWTAVNPRILNMTLA